MTLEELINRLKELPPDLRMDGLRNPHSYRGYYCELAFERDNKKYVSEVLEEALRCVNQVFEGYRGGDYIMHMDTPVWIANYSCTGVKIANILDNGTIETKEDTYD